MLDERVIPYVPWDEFVSHYFHWRQGEHVTFIGPTGSGKSTAALAILPLRKYVIVLCTKPRDSNLDKFAKQYDYIQIQQWKNLKLNKYPRRIIWPKAKNLRDMVNKQLDVFEETLDVVYQDGGWCIYLDELWWMINQLKLDLYVKTYSLQARSLFITLVTSQQRPRWVPLEVYSQSTHFFLFQATDREDIRRLADMGSKYTEQIAQIVPQLDNHEMLYVKARGDNQMIMRTKAPKP